MSAALNRADSSLQSSGTLQDLSLGSLASFSSPARFRVPSASSGTTAPSSVQVSTPSPPSAHHFTRRKVDDGSTPNSKRLAFSKSLGDDDAEDTEGGDVLDTPAREGKADNTNTPMPNRISSKRKSGANGAKGGSNLTLRDQEKVR